MIIAGDCRKELKSLEAGSVNCCVTSPPYWGLRDYIQGLTLHEDDKPIFSNSLFQPFDDSRFWYDSKTLFSNFRRDTRNEKFLKTTAKSFRKTFVTLASKAGCGEVFIQRYIGHTPSNMLQEHYQGITLDDLRREICLKMDRYMSVADGDCNIVGVSSLQSIE